MMRTNSVKNAGMIAMLQAMMYSSFIGYDDFTGHVGRSVSISFERVNIKGMSAKELGTSNGKKKSRAKRKRSRR